MDMHDESMPHSDMEHDSGADEAKAPAMGVVHIHANMLPKGMAESIKAGEILEFKVIGPMDEESEIPVEYNTGKSDASETDESSGEKEGSWESDFRKAMSPRAEGEDGAMGGNSNGGGY